MMDKLLELLKKYDVTEYEAVTWIASALEYKLGDDDCTERIEKLVDSLNALSWRAYERS